MAALSVNKPEVFIFDLFFLGTPISVTNDLGDFEEIKIYTC